MLVSIIVPSLLGLILILLSVKLSQSAYSGGFFSARRVGKLKIGTVLLKSGKVGRYVHVGADIYRYLRYGITRFDLR